MAQEPQERHCPQLSSTPPQTASEHRTLSAAGSSQSGAQAASAQLVLPQHLAGGFSLTVVATSRETVALGGPETDLSDNAASRTVVQVVSVSAVADAPVLVVRGTAAGLYRVTYTGKESTAAAWEPNKEGAEARALRRRLEAFHGKADPKALDFIWPHLNSPDRANPRDFRQIRDMRVPRRERLRPSARERWRSYVPL